MTEVLTATPDATMGCNPSPARVRRFELAAAADEAAELFEQEVAKRPSRARLAHQARRVASVLRMGAE